MSSKALPHRIFLKQVARASGALAVGAFRLFSDLGW
jgi:hypothetical protein